jgi:hypothetical protein
MLALDWPRQPRGRRPGQHARTADEQARAGAHAAFLRYDAPGQDRFGRLARVVLGRRLLPAAVTLAEAVGAVLTEGSSGRDGTPAA